MKNDFGLFGLGVMGKSLSLNIAENGFALSVYNRSEEKEANIISDFINENINFNIDGFTDLAAFINSLATPRKVFLMVQAGQVVDLVIEQLLPLLEENDIIIDGGNSHFEDSERRYHLLKKQGFHFISCGVSGGEKGARFGPSIMPSGDAESYHLIAPILEKIAAKDKNGRACCTYIGEKSAGHFVKMVHNGIEYAEMQLLAEAKTILEIGNDYEKIVTTFKNWNNGDLNSYLLEITAKILQKKEGENYLLDLILDKAGNKGTGSWSSQTTLKLGLPTTLMTDAVFARYISALKSKRVELSKRLTISVENTTKLDSDLIKSAYEFTRIINHHQGFELIKIAGKQKNLNLNLSEIARIWTNGCIIRSALMEEIVDYFQIDNTLIQQEHIFDNLSKLEDSIQQVLYFGMKNRLHLPILSAAYQYWIGMTTANLSANVNQAQRDFFGAHAYQRTDKSETDFFHTEWEE